MEASVEKDRPRGFVMSLEADHCEITTWQASVECPKCRRNVPPYAWHSEKKCIRAQMRRDARAKGRVQPILIVVLGITRPYGGPEEGGWWWDRREILEVRKAWSFRTAREAIRELRDDYPKPRYPRGSVLGGQDIFILTCMHEGEFPSEVLTRPTYE